VSGDIVQYPRGSRALLPDYYSAAKKPAFLQNQAGRRRHRHHILRLEHRRQRVCDATQCKQATTQVNYIRIVENADEIRLFRLSAVCKRARRATLRRAARASSESRNAALIILIILCKIFPEKWLAPTLASVEFGANRANRSEVIRAKPTTEDRRRRTERGNEKHGTENLAARLRRSDALSSVFRPRACA
jgi:hypothetical protein